MESVAEGKSWSLYDHLALYEAYQKYIEAPDLIDVEALRIPNKSKQAVARMLNNIHERGDDALRRLFPRDPTQWSSQDEQELLDAFRVSRSGCCVVDWLERI